MTDLPTGTRKWYVLIWRAFALAVIFAVIAVIALVGFFRSARAADQAHHAADEARSTSDCLNNILATRSGVTNKDQKALLDFMNSADRNLPLFATDPDVAAKRLHDQIHRSRLLLLADKRYRAHHPLGHC